MAHSRLSLGALVASTMVVLTIVAGCSRSEPLEDRVRSYWQGRAKRDFGLTYELENPTYRGKREEYLARMGSGPMQLKLLDVEKVEVLDDGEKARVELRVEYSLPGVKKPVRAPLVDRWVRQDGRWYREKKPAGTKRPDTPPLWASKETWEDPNRPKTRNEIGEERRAAASHQSATVAAPTSAGTPSPSPSAPPATNPTTAP